MKTHLLEHLLGCELEETLIAISADIDTLETFLATLPTDSVENHPHTAVGRTRRRQRHPD